MSGFFSFSFFLFGPEALMEAFMEFYMNLQDNVFALKLHVFYP